MKLTVTWESLIARQKEIDRQIKECVACARNVEFCTIGERADAIKRKATLEGERAIVRKEIAVYENSSLF